MIAVDGFDGWEVEGRWRGGHAVVVAFRRGNEIGVLFPAQNPREWARLLAMIEDSGDDVRFMDALLTAVAHVQATMPARVPLTLLFAPTDPAVVLAAGVGGSQPPSATWAESEITDWKGWTLRVGPSLWTDGQRALVLVWKDVVAPEGVDRLVRLCRARDAREMSLADVYSATGAWQIAGLAQTVGLGTRFRLGDD